MGGCRSNFILFLKTKEAKPPSMKPPQNEKPKISLLWQRNYLSCSSCGCRSGSSAWNTFQPCPDRWLIRLSPFAKLLCSEDITYTQSPSNQSCFCSPFRQNFVIGDSASSKSFISPFQRSFLLLHVYQYWLVSLKFVQKRGNSSCWYISNSCFLLTVFHTGINSGLHWVSGNFAFSFHQVKISSVIFRYHRELAPHFIISACSETCFLYSLSTLSFSSSALPLKCCTAVESPCRKGRENFLWRTWK